VNLFLQAVAPVKILSYRLLAAMPVNSGTAMPIDSDKSLKIRRFGSKMRDNNNNITNVSVREVTFK